MSLDLSMVDETFLQKIASPEGAETVSQEMRMAIKTEVLESGFMNALIPSQPISVNECYKNIGDNSLYILREIETNAKAMVLDNYAQPYGEYVQASRFKIPVVQVATARFQILVTDLRAYMHNVIDRVYQKTGPYIDKIIDKYGMRLFINSLNAYAAAGSQKAVAYQGTPTYDQFISLPDVVKLFKVLHAGTTGHEEMKKQMTTMLMSVGTYESASNLVSAGDNFNTERVVNGYRYKTLFGHNVVSTIKSDIIPDGHIWGFGAPDYLGHYFTLGDPEFEIHTKFGLTQFQTVYWVALGVASVAAVSLLTLKGSVDKDNNPLEVSATGTLDANVLDFYNFKLF